MPRCGFSTQPKKRKECEEETCTTVPVFNYPGESTGRFCKQHSLDGMMDVKSRRCAERGCDKYPAFNYANESTSRFCGEHKKPGMVDVHNKRCAEPNCNTRPTFNYPGQAPAFCVHHKKDGMVNNRHKPCQHEGCESHATFKPTGVTGPPLYCAIHKGDGMVQSRSRQCAHANCDKRPNFNYEGQLPLYCPLHKSDGMVDVLNRLCQHPGCNKLPSFNFPNVSPAACCGKHREPGMVNVRHRVCQQPNCGTEAKYNVPGASTGAYCGTHKLEGMVRVNSRKCEADGCDRRASFNHPGLSAGYCGQHKTEGMIDVANRRCEHPGCTKAPAFNYEGQQRRLFCASHKLDGMVNLRKKRARPSESDPQAQAEFSQDLNMMMGSPDQGMSGLASPPNFQHMGPHGAHGEYVNQENPEGHQMPEGQHMGGQHDHMSPHDPHVPPPTTHVMPQDQHAYAASMAMHDMFGGYHVGHMGSGNFDPLTMDPSIAQSAGLMHHMAAHMLHMDGFPVPMGHMVPYALSGPTSLGLDMGLTSPPRPPIPGHGMQGTSQPQSMDPSHGMHMIEHAQNMHTIMGPMGYPMMHPGIHGMSSALVSHPGHVTTHMVHMASAPGSGPPSQPVPGAPGSAQQTLAPPYSMQFMPMPTQAMHPPAMHGVHQSQGPDPGHMMQGASSHPQTQDHRARMQGFPPAHLHTNPALSAGQSPHVMQGMSGPQTLGPMSAPQPSGMPFNLPGLPGQQQVIPNQQQVMPGQQPGVPAQQPGVPGQQPGLPGQHVDPYRPPDMQHHPIGSTEMSAILGDLQEAMATTGVPVDGETPQGEPRVDGGVIRAAASAPTSLPSQHPQNDIKDGTGGPAV